MNGSARDGWCPIRVFRDEGVWLVDWVRLGDQRFDEPFFEDTIGMALRHPFNRAFGRRTRLDDLGQRFGGSDAPSPAGLVFHMSRCGSTLVAQMLASLDGSVVLSEPIPVDEVLRAQHHDSAVTDAWREERLRWLVGALYASVRGDVRRFVLKLDAWHVLDLPLIRRAFPNTPWVFLYRDPAEVMVSHRRQASFMMSAVNSRHFLDLDPADAVALRREEYHARVLARICAAVVERENDPLRRLVNYSELPTAAEDDIPRWFGIDVAADERERLAETARRDAKRPYQEFTADRDDKRHGAAAAIREAVASWLDTPYAALEARRLTR